LPRFKLAIEVDGATHQTNEELEHDKKRQQYLENKGVEFLRFTNEDIYSGLDKVLKNIQNKVQLLS
jgi:5-methyltetrahydrofolate--homocysteine methyltransferase